MATKAENAEALKQALGIELDPTRSDPKADLFTQWAGRLQDDQEGVRKDVLTWQVQDALDIELASDRVTTDQLQGWLGALAQGTSKEDLARQVQDALRSALAPQVSAPASPTPTTEQPAVPEAAPAGEGEVTVQVIGRTATYGGAYTDPISKKTIGRAPVTVPRTSFIDEKITAGEMSEVAPPQE